MAFAPKYQTIAVKSKTFGKIYNMAERNKDQQKNLDMEAHILDEPIDDM